MKRNVGREESEVKTSVEKELSSTSTLIQDKGVLDTWFSSELLPSLTMGLQDDDDPDFRVFFLKHSLKPDYDILFSWVVRMAKMSLWICWKLPLSGVIFLIIVRYENGANKSKSE